MHRENLPLLRKKSGKRCGIFFQGWSASPMHHYHREAILPFPDMLPALQPALVACCRDCHFVPPRGCYFAPLGVPLDLRVAAPRPQHPRTGVVEVRPSGPTGAATLESDDLQKVLLACCPPRGGLTPRVYLTISHNLFIRQF